LAKEIAHFDGIVGQSVLELLDHVGMVRANIAPRRVGKDAIDDSFASVLESVTSHIEGMVDPLLIVVIKPAKHDVSDENRKTDEYILITQQ
jgi:hypothetical protein